MKPAGLYLHVPFCIKKCVYCSFFSREPTSAEVSAWLAGIQRDLLAIPPQFAPTTVYIGGGTPTALPATELAALLTQVRTHVDLRQLEEWTVEANPGTLTPEKLHLLRTAGVNRLSIGAQSFKDSVLRRLGRIHTPADICESVAAARASGFDNIGLDIIYGLPTVFGADLRNDIEAAIALAPEHLSCYCLEIEDSTPLFRQQTAEGWRTDDALQREQYDFIRKRLSDAEWTHYEISNFARPGRESRHNGLYWCGGEYIGIGPAAYSHWNGTRYAHTAECPGWTRSPGETLAPEAKARETLVMGLRRLAGWERSQFRAITGFDMDDLRGPEISHLAAEGLLLVTPDRIRLAPEALFISDTVFRELV